MKTPYMITLKETLALVLREKHPKRHVCVLWGIERLTQSFYDLSWLDAKRVAFVRDVSEGTFFPQC